MSARTIGKGAEFRALHEEEGAFVIPNPWDVGTARILWSLGFRALATTSAGHAFSSGVREGGLTEDAMLEHCRLIVTATDLPVSADLERGFGDSPESVARTIVAAAATGLAGCSIEDYTGRPDEPIYDLALAVERIEAAAEAARALPDDFVLTARCENFRWGRPDIEDTISRLQAFERAGADVLYAPGLRDLEMIGRVCSSLARPVNVLMGLPGAAFSVDDLASVGVKRISVGGVLARLALGAVVDAGREIQEHGTFTFGPRAMGSAELEDLIAGPKTPG